MSKALGISIKHPVIYNTHRSSIVNVREKQTDVYPLYLSNYQDYKTLEKACDLSQQNLKNIKRALFRLRYKENMGGSASADIEQLKFNNLMLFYLFQIADFQV
jgi:uncharacterized Fe-S cluster-containing radical SAM superfamily protein